MSSIDLELFLSEYNKTLNSGGDLPSFSLFLDKIKQKLPTTTENVGSESKKGRGEQEMLTEAMIWLMEKKINSFIEEISAESNENKPGNQESPKVVAFRTFLTKQQGLLY